MSRTILVLDDNERARRLAELMLTELGHEVVVTGTAAQALEVVASGRHIDLLFSDVVLGGEMNGPDVAAQARERRPDLPVLFASGHTRRGVVANGLLSEDAPFIAKPYRRAALAESVERMLADKRLDEAC